MPKKRISFSESDAAHIYEWLVMYWHTDQLTFGGCHECKTLGKRLEKLIGPKMAAGIRRVVREHP